MKSLIESILDTDFEDNIEDQVGTAVKHIKRVNQFVEDMEDILNREVDDKFVKCENAPRSVAVLYSQTPSEGGKQLKKLKTIIEQYIKAKRLSNMFYLSSTSDSICVRYETNVKIVTVVHIKRYAFQKYIKLLLEHL